MIRALLARGAVFALLVVGAVPLLDLGASASPSAPCGVGLSPVLRANGGSSILSCVASGPGVVSNTSGGGFVAPDEQSLLDLAGFVPLDPNSMPLEGAPGLWFWPGTYSGPLTAGMYVILGQEPDNSCTGCGSDWSALSGFGFSSAPAGDVIEDTSAQTLEVVLTGAGALAVGVLAVSLGWVAVRLIPSAVRTVAARFSGAG